MANIMLICFDNLKEIAPVCVAMAAMHDGGFDLIGHPPYSRGGPPLPKLAEGTVWQS